ncbi:Amino acid permease [Staphylococcus aureus]|nr:Amino acid permease [Staphylococcus aureus]
MNKDKQLHNDKINLSQLVLLGLGSLIGSGWLFGAWEASSIAGPAAIISWVLGFLVIGTIAYNYIEIGTMFPQSGGMSNYAQYTHGSLLGFIAAWANWVSLVTRSCVSCSIYEFLAVALGETNEIFNGKWLY